VDECSGQPSGIERAAEQGSDAFQAQQFPGPVPDPMPTGIGPPIEPGMPQLPANDLFSRPHVMEGAWYVSADRGSWWNGVMWVPGRPPGSSTDGGDATAPGVPDSGSAAAPLILFLIGLAVMGAILFMAWQAFQAMPNLTSPP